MTASPGPAATTAWGCAVRLTPEGTIVEVLVDPLGRCPGTAGAPFLDLLDVSSCEKGELLLDRVCEDGHVFGWELRLADPDRTLLRFAGVRDGPHLLVMGTPASDALGGDGVGGEHRHPELDAELLHLHRELARRTAELEEVNEQKNELIGMAAHDLRNPIGAIRGFAQLLIARISDRLDDRERLVLERIERSSEHMLDLVNDLLELTDVDRRGLAVRLQRSDVDLAGLLSASIEVERALAEPKDITIVLEVADAPLVAPVDERKIEQVFANLLSNAVKFSPTDATVVVRLEGRDDVVLLEVTDHGPGIPLEERELVFEPFARTSARPTGGERSTGLGLAIVRRIVEGHGGRIELHSEVGAGSTFRVLLPRTPEGLLPPALSVQAGAGPSSPARSHPTTSRTPS
jgi:signal transduction histidine kinase